MNEKLDFNDVVKNNIDYVKSIVRKYAKNPSIVEELTQEIFIRAFRSYDKYIEQGKVRHWLAVIAENKLKKDYKSAKKYQDNHYDIDDIFFQNTLAAPESSNPEDIIIKNEQTEKIMSIINRLPRKQRDIIMYRYVYDYSVKEVEQIMGITASNVKVTAHTAINSIREKMGINQTKLKGEKVMKFDNKTAYSYLYQYAKGHISAENKAAVEEYLKTDEEAANIAEALKILHPQIVLGKDDEATWYDIIFQLKNGDTLIYQNIGDGDGADRRINRGGFSIEQADYILNTFDNEGDVLEFKRRVHKDDSGEYVIDVGILKDPPYEPVYWSYQVNCESNTKVFEQSKDSPNLYKIVWNNYSCLSSEYYKMARYIALPEAAKNIRVKRGNGVIECGKYKFAYADRYVLQDESLALDCTFNLN